ncbi:response regulator transcription factor [Crossiella cryophila]|uniref:DNA-binding response OmpR family regulator n=1 Tax=Crossiella cryophila TaxID=43355 RepID=A0A7W7FTV9_9PSEU|nr:response regulator transcription factor [Crossiella cryophila]MBB4678591.1 DNA-binding response OmpR family regulator [Crossiella cryophila]
MCADILVAEDNSRQAELIRRYLEHDGHTVSVVFDGEAALARTRQLKPDMIVLDVMMPGLSGLEVCARLRAESDVAIVLLTARSMEPDVLTGFDLGADDYITKPFRPRQLVARVRSILRRTSPRPAEATDSPLLSVGEITVDRVAHEVCVRGQRVDLTPAEFQLLGIFAAAPNRVFTRKQLIEDAFGTEFMTERAVDVRIMKLRKKIEIDPRRPRLLVTVYGIGYKLADDKD